MLSLRLALLPVAMLFLSGCSLLPTPPAAQETETQDAFAAKPVPGSIWVSFDGGKAFEPRVYVDEKRKITKADILDISFLLRDGGEGVLARELRRTPDVYAATVEDMVFKTVDGSDTWEPINFPPQKIYSFIASRRSVDRMYATGSIGNRGKIFRTIDGGTTWQDVYTEPGTGTTIVSLTEHPRNVNVLFAGTSAGTVVKSVDGGDTWKNVGGQVNGPVTTIAVDATNDALLYLLAYNGKLYVSETAGDVWIDLDLRRQEERRKNPGTTTGPAPVVPTSPVTLVPDPNVSGTFYVGTKTGLFRTRDAGLSFEKVNIIESAEQFSLRSFAINPKNSNELIFAAGRAFYKSMNGGETWSVLPLAVDRDISVIAYDPVFPETIYLGLRKMK
jgi:photosystem II stability/assembly factor-like uncharacterized protein